MTIKLFTVASRITGVFLLLITVLFTIRLATQHELWAFGPDGFLSLAPYYMQNGEKMGLPSIGIDLTVLSLIVHGWLYVFYLYTDFRLWTETRWSFGRFVLIALGGVVPFLSFFTERRFSRLAKGETN